MSNTLVQGKTLEISSFQGFNSYFFFSRTVNITVGPGLGQGSEVCIFVMRYKTGQNLPSKFESNTTSDWLNRMV